MSPSEIRVPDTAAPLTNYLWLHRLCPGKPLAENSVFIIIATLLTVFNIAPPPDGELVPKYTAGLVRYARAPSQFTSPHCSDRIPDMYPSSYPLPFKCAITPRSQSRVSQILWRAAHCTV